VVLRLSLFVEDACVDGPFGSQQCSRDENALLEFMYLHSRREQVSILIALLAGVLVLLTWRRVTKQGEARTTQPIGE
jgi:hypothetical protein